MRHQKAGLKLGRTTSHRTAMFRNMVTSLLKYDRIQTTDVKAKELKRWADNIITLAKRGDLHARRQALSIVREKDVVHKLFAEAAERFGSRSGGYTRIVKLGRRPGDSAPISIIELIDSEKAKTRDKKAQKKKGAKATQTKTKKVADEKIVKKEAAASADQLETKEGQASGASEKVDESSEKD